MLLSRVFDKNVDYRAHAVDLLTSSATLLRRKWSTSSETTNHAGSPSGATDDATSLSQLSLFDELGNELENAFSACDALRELREKVSVANQVPK